MRQSSGSCRKVLEELLREGKVRHLGVANFGLNQMEKLLQSASVKPVVNQVELHPYLSQRKLVGTCRRKVCKFRLVNACHLCRTVLSRNCQHSILCRRKGKFLL